MVWKDGRFNFLRHRYKRHDAVLSSRVWLTAGLMEWGGVQAVRMVLSDWPCANLVWLGVRDVRHYPTRRFFTRL